MVLAFVGGMRNIPLKGPLSTLGTAAWLPPRALVAKLSLSVEKKVLVFLLLVRLTIVSRRCIPVTPRMWSRVTVRRGAW